MIAIDTSALIAILLNEPDAGRHAETIARADRAVISAPTAFEYLLVAERKKGVDGVRQAERILFSDPIEIVPWDAALLPAAQQALRRFGGRPARLNFGDCLSYALAASLDVPLLYKGSDFAATDIRPALG